MKKEKLKQFTHLLAGFLILIHAFQTFEKEDHQTSFVFLFIAIAFLVIAGIHHWLARQIRKADGVCFILEAIALYFSAWHYRLDGLTYMIIISAVLATLYLWLGIYLVSQKSQRHRHRKHHRSRSTRSNSDTLN